jgi:hypothetical protein
MGNVYKLRIIRKFSYVKPFIVKEKIGTSKLDKFLLKIASMLFKEKK